MGTAKLTAILMDSQDLFDLMSWMSPSYPVGAYTYSHGIEYAVEADLISGLDNLVPWIEDILAFGSGLSDCILLKAGYAAAAAKDGPVLKEVAELGLALCSTEELETETTQQGRAFLQVMTDVSPLSGRELLKQHWQGQVVYPLAVALAAEEKKIPLEATLTAYLHGFVSNLVSASVRIIPLGQTDGQRAIAALAPKVAQTVDKALASGLEDLGAATLMVDWCSAQHETQYTRLFRS
ncbi:MAG: urease accessory protein UreF [Proteobacteria bacterium]|nr:urease accessory protein UreF [Pseudomonadota bacterium]